MGPTTPSRARNEDEPVTLKLWSHSSKNTIMLWRPVLSSAFLTAGAAVVQAQAPAAPEAFPACPSQQMLDQVRGSRGQYVPDDCRRLSVTVIRTPAGNEDCLLNFKPGPDPGILDRLAGAAMPTQWWVACEKLRDR